MQDALAGIMWNGIQQLSKSEMCFCCCGQGLSRGTPAGVYAPASESAIS